ncbi:DUF3857 domain-containing protein [Panacibacter sp. DH6]|uniref:DUF3857 domain-containing protein n=1 Tax=Panacibacter microcysteis TaxID=2793269 RepID=A0A931E680_9BACT|nr:DUF3857 domain-containing protein [Panacibacter microcysteis]MBG9376236.1 DUF3857 domain-containing protein [Panacibacter microcysteis]
MKRSLLALLIFSGITNGYAQEYNYDTQQKWEDKPVLHKVNTRYDSASAVAILDERSIEYVKIKEDLVVHETDHVIIHIMDDNGIEMYNKIYIPLYRSSSIKNIKARTILPGGKIIELSQSAIKEIEEDGRLYKLFAMDGLEKGCEVEYSWQEERPLSIFGSEVFQRGNIPSQSTRFVLSTPSHLKFDVKGYNGFRISQDSLIGEERIIAGFSDNIDQMEEEKYAFTDPYLQRVDYKLSYNLSKNENIRMYTWKDLAKQVYPYYTVRTSKEEKALESFIKKMPAIDALKTANAILAIEDYIKTNINVNEELIADEAANIEFIVKNKSTNHSGIIRLFAGVFDKMNISYQLVYPGTRTGFTLDEQLENWDRADDMIIYFPSVKKFISPVNVELRYPYIPYQYIYTKGLFLKGTVVGELKTAVGSFATIGAESFDQHAMNMEAAIKFSREMDTVIISSRQILTGYGATNYRPIYTFLPQDKQDEANKEIIKGVAGSEDISNIKIEGTNLNDYFDNKPLTIGADIKSTTLLERAGNKVLFKLGEIIGQQAEMYQEKPRHLPVELPYPHVLNRKIVFEIPGGYSVKNLDDINLSVVHKENDTVTMGFVSNYTKSGNAVTVNIYETYAKIYYPLEQFEDFKKVINASADFNKITLVLQKEN